MQAAGYLVGIVVELPACVEHGHDDLGGGTAFLRVDVHGDATAVVLDRDGPVRMDGDGDFRAIIGQGLVDGIIHHLEHHVVQAGTVIGVADVHTRAFANRIQPFQYLDIRGIVAHIRILVGGISPAR